MKRRHFLAAATTAAMPARAALGQGTSGASRVLKFIPQADPAVLKEQLKNAADMIEQGTEPKPGNFANFEPVLDAGGKIAALRFVFPPYQVGPYSDGTQTVEVPAAVLLPHVPPIERGLFAGG